MVEIGNQRASRYLPLLVKQTHTDLGTQIPNMPEHLSYWYIQIKTYIRCITFTAKYPHLSKD